MRGMARKLRIFAGCCSLGFGCAVLCGLMATGSASHAQTSLQLEKQRERLIVSAMALRDGDLLADEAANYSAFQQNREQVLTLELGMDGQRQTLLIRIWDRDAGGVRVGFSVFDSKGNEGEVRDFIMYPFVDKAAHRAEPLRLPIMRIVDSGNDQLIDIARVELQITMKRVVPRR